jgi:transaldolase
MVAAVGMCRSFDKGIEVLWASSREAFNIVQAAQAGCHIITLTPDLLKKAASFGKSLADFSLDTVRMFRSDALASGFAL